MLLKLQFIAVDYSQGLFLVEIGVLPSVGKVAVLNYYCFYYHHRHRIIRIAIVLYAGEQLPCNVNEASTTIYIIYIVIDETKMYKPRCIFIYFSKINIIISIQ